MEKIKASKRAITKVQREVKHQTLISTPETSWPNVTFQVFFWMSDPTRVKARWTRNSREKCWQLLFCKFFSIMYHVFEEVKHEGWNLHSALCFIFLPVILTLTSTLPSCSHILPSNECPLPAKCTDSTLCKITNSYY